MSHDEAARAANTTGDSSLTRLSPTTQLVLALLAGTATTLAFSVLFVGFEPRGVGLALAGYLAGAIFAVALIRRGYPHRVLGFGNLTTVFRMTMVAALLAPLGGIAMPWAVVALAIFALVLDGVDGALARRANLVSNFGGKLDMEIDSILALILALNVWAAGITGPWIIFLDCRAICLLSRQGLCRGWINLFRRACREGLSALCRLLPFLDCMLRYFPGFWLSRSQS
jgi:Phosphatidylglycerophosphate synthase